MKSLYRLFMMATAVVAIFAGSQAMAAPSTSRVLIGNAATMKQGTLGYVTVTNNSNYKIFVRVPSVDNRAYALVPDQSGYFDIGNKMGAYVFVSYSFNRFDETSQFIYNGGEAEIYDPLYMAKGSNGQPKGHVKVHMIVKKPAQEKAIA